MASIYDLSLQFKPAGDQPTAIKQLVAGVSNGMTEQTLLGVTGSGKTFTMANVIAQVGKPAMIMAHNKTLAAQLYAEFREFFPHNAVEYFVSYYDYYQPEAYVPSRDLFIEKDSSINAHIEQMRLSATKSLMERRDCIIVATVSAIYGIGDPVDYHSMILHLKNGDTLTRSNIIKRLTAMQYERDRTDFRRGTYRVKGDTIDVFPAENFDQAIRIELFDEVIENLILFDPLTGNKLKKLVRFTVYPSSHYVATRQTLNRAMKEIKTDLKERLAFYNDARRVVEATRLEERTRFDLEMMEVAGFCKGIENYSRYLSGRNIGEPPPTLFDYLPSDSLLFIDESHITVSQIGAMFRGDRSRKETLVEYGFRLPAALDNRPLKFEEFRHLMPQTIYVSATPAVFEKTHSKQVVEQVVRPTGLLDPVLVVRPAQTQVEDISVEISQRIKKKERTLVTTLTKRMAEQLTQFLVENGIKARYLHADIDTIERADILHHLRLGTFDVLVGINLLREGLDLPEVSFVGILDADKEGFLRSEQSLIQTIGRAARHLNGTVILYADKITQSMERAINETNRRRELQLAFNKKHGITPQSIIKPVKKLIDIGEDIGKDKNAPQQNKWLKMNEKQLGKEIARLEKKMLQHARLLEFEQAAAMRDDIRLLKEQVFHQH